MARRNAWLTPDVGNGEMTSRCLTVPRSMLPHVAGALSALTEVWRWEQYGDMSPEDAAHFAVIMLDQFTNECGANVLLRQNPAIPCILERSDDNGETWQVFADMTLCLPDEPPEPSPYEDVRYNEDTGVIEFSLDGGDTWSPVPIPNEPEPTSPYTPQRQPAEGANDEEKRCNAADRASRNLSLMYQQTYGAIGAGLMNTLSQINVFLADLNDFLAGIVWGTYWDLAKALGFSLALDPVHYTAPELTNSQIDILRCLLYEHSTVTNSIVSFDFGAVRDNVIADLGINPGTAVWTHLNYVQEAGLNRLGEVGFGGGEYNCEDCALDPDDAWLQWGGEQGTSVSLTFNTVNLWHELQGIAEQPGPRIGQISRIGGGNFVITQLQHLSGTGGIASSGHMALLASGVWDTSMTTAELYNTPVKAVNLRMIVDTWTSRTKIVAHKV